MILSLLEDWSRVILDLNRLQAGLILIVALSGGSVALYGEASPVHILASILAGLLVGIALTAYLTWIVPDSGLTEPPR